jgi:hypothetical protein
MKKLAVTAALFLGALLGATLGFGGGVPNIPSTPTFNEPSQIVSTLNAFINQMNGFPSGSGGYAAQPGGIVSLGTFATASGATPQTANTTRGNVTFTGVTVAGVSTGNVVINNSLITAGNTCRAWLTADNSAAASFPYVRSVVTGTGTITVAISNAAAATSTGSSTFGVGFDCIN